VERGPVQRGDWILAWETVEANRDRFVVHPEAAFVADSTVPLADNVAAIVNLLRSTA
jgi:hypothetical protein